MLELLKQPWPWYVGGPLIGLTVPALLLLGNKQFGISSSLRHICAACLPAKIPFFRYNWKKEVWNLFFAAGIIIGAFLASHFLSTPGPVHISAATQQDLAALGIRDFDHLLPTDVFNFSNLLSRQGFLLMVVGGFLVGFGTRYAGGCTSGHSINGISQLQWPSVVATLCFMAGGFFVTQVLFPFIFK